MSKSNGIGGEMGGLIKIETITPAMARALLARDSKNRKIKPATVERYAKEMAGDKWQLNGETIKIADNGDVLDGQHRLAACVESNTSFETVIVYDLPTSAFKTIDNGAPRTLNDLLYLKGVPNASVMAAAAGYIMYWDGASEKTKMRISRPHPKERPTRNEKFEWLESSDPAIWKLASSMAFRFRGLAPPSIVAASCYIAARRNLVKAEDFFEQAATGVGVWREDDPAGRLRSRLIRDRGKRVQASPWEKFGWFMKAWAAYSAGKPLKTLRVRTKGRTELVGSIQGAAAE